MLKKSKMSVQSVKAVLPPDITELHHLLSQALEKRGQHIQLQWKSTDKMATFILDVLCNIKGGDPLWCLYSEHRGQRKLLVNYSSCDVLLVHNVLLASAVPPTPAAQGPKGLVATNPLGISDAVYSVIEDARQESEKTVVARIDVPKRPDFPLTGDIGSANMPLAKLLQAIQQSQSTGKLEVRNKAQVTAIVYVQNGQLVDATASDAEGDDAIIDLLMWTDGQYEFETRVLRNSHTVHKTLDALVAQSKQLQERMAFLRNAGMQFSSALEPTNADLTELEFVQKVARGAPATVEVMSKFYRSLDGKHSVEEMLRVMPFSRIELVNLIHFLLSNHLIRIAVAPEPVKPLTVQPRVIDTAAIQTVMMSLRRAETGMFIYPAFLYFLEQEYFRSYRARSPLSVIVFQMRAVTENGRRVLPAPAITDAVIRISQLKRHVDLLAHYDAFDYALMLPNTKANGAQIFANRVVKTLRATPLAGEYTGANLSLAFGCASIPEDFMELSSFLGGADLAMNQSIETKQPLVMYRDLKSKITQS